MRLSSFKFFFIKLKNEDHFLVLAIESSFGEKPTNESIQFRVYLLKALKQSFLSDLKSTPAECEKVWIWEKHLIQLYYTYTLIIKKNILVPKLKPFCGGSKNILSIK